MLDRVNFKHFVMPYPNYYHLGCGKRLFLSTSMLKMII
jgi:hypothetical protein